MTASPQPPRNPDPASPANPTSMNPANGNSVRPVTDDVRIGGLRSLMAPVVLMEEQRLRAAEAGFVADTRQRVEAIVTGTDDRLLVVAGPCSIHDKEIALEYADRLKPLIDAHRDDLEILMRVYFEKPRTTIGWKGYINDPGLDDSFDINRGLRLARELLIELARRRVGAGTEFLDTIIPQYIADAVSWGAIGARTTESQVHRELASGLSMPVGFKNGTDGNVRIAIDAIGAARHVHHFLSVTKQGVAAIVETRGNDACHVILRGSSAGSNHDPGSVAAVLEGLRAAGLRPHLMVDCSHGNSRKDHRNQPAVAADVAAQISGGQRGIMGVMLESHLVAGKQPLGDPTSLVRGQSVTDACIDLDTTAAVLDQLASAVRQRRTSRS